MNTFRYFLFTAALVFSAFSIVTYTSCKTNKCKDLNCINGGGCLEGICKCPTGYSGIICENVPDLCADIQCNNGGTCDQGLCKCPTGYEGEKCEEKTNAKYIGQYSVLYHCSLSGTGSNTSAVIQTSDITDMLMTNFHIFPSSPVHITPYRSNKICL